MNKMSQTFCLASQFLNLKPNKQTNSAVVGQDLTKSSLDKDPKRLATKTG